MAAPLSMRPLQHWPLNLLLTFVVSVIIVTHLVLCYRLARSSVGTTTPT